MEFCNQQLPTVLELEGCPGVYENFLNVWECSTEVRLLLTPLCLHYTTFIENLLGAEKNDPIVERVEETFVRNKMRCRLAGAMNTHDTG